MRSASLSRFHQAGFTLVEVVIAGAIMSVMFLLSTQSLFGGIRSATLDQASAAVVREMNAQQAKAMQGLVTVTGAVVDYSIRFEQDRYIVYPGSVYDGENSLNQTVLLEPTMQFATIAVPDQTITYARGKGDVRGYLSGADYVVLSDLETGASVTISVNAAGVAFVSRQ